MRASTTKQHQVGLAQGDLDLVFDILGQVVDVLDAHAARVDHLQIAIADVDGRRQAIARDAGRGIDDGDAPARQPIEKRRFAHVGPTDDGDLRNGHDNTPAHDCKRSLYVIV